jgi:hypothetical protein
MQINADRVADAQRLLDEEVGNMARGAAGGQQVRQLVFPYLKTNYSVSVKRYQRGEKCAPTCSA